MSMYRLFASLCVTAFLLVKALPVNAADSPATEDWQYFGEVYLWGAAIGGESAAGDDIDISFSDIMDNLDLGIMAALGARKGKWTLLTDAIYLDLESEESSTANLIGIPVKADLDVELRGWIVTAAGGYNLVETDGYRLDLLAGARYLWLDLDLKFDLGTKKVPFSESEGYLDAIVGVRGKSEFAQKWALVYHLDAGTGDTDFSWQALGAVNYRFDKVDAVFGYRYLEWNFDDDKAFNDLDISGPFVGVKVQF